MDRTAMDEFSPPRDDGFDNSVTPERSPPLREVPTEWEAEGVGAKCNITFPCINRCGGRNSPFTYGDPEVPEGIPNGEVGNELKDRIS